MSVSVRATAIAAVLLLAAVQQPPRHERDPRAPLSAAHAIAALRTMPIAFEPNVGQADREAAFVARGRGYAVLAHPDGPVLQFHREPGTAPAVVRMRLVNGRTAARITPASLLGGRSNYLLGNDPSAWRINVPRYEAVRYEQVYDGVDLLLYGAADSLEYDLMVAPGQDPRRIAVAFDGAARPRLAADGDLLLGIAGGDVRFHRPVVYQEVDGRRVGVDARYDLRADDSVGFHVGRYDVSRPLVIDPVLDYSTYVGGSLNAFNGFSSEEATDVAVDANGNAYLTGFTNAVNFPIAGAPPFDGTCGSCSSGVDAFVVKIDPSQTGAASLVYATYLGAPGLGSTTGQGIAVDPLGQVYVTGSTNAFNNPSTPINDAFPTTASAFQSNDSGDNAVADGFLAKLSADGASLMYSTYLGGANLDEGLAVVADAAQVAYVAGRTAAVNFPAIKNAYKSTNPTASLDAFVVRIDTLASGAASLLYGTYLGGTGQDTGEGIAIDASGTVYVAGSTQAPANFPIVNGFQSTIGPGIQGFMARIDPAKVGAASLLYSTYIGGTGAQSDMPAGVAVDANGYVYVAGSNGAAAWPSTPGAYKTAFQNTDAFVVKIDPALTGAASLVASSLLGGIHQDSARDITVDTFGNPVIAGWTTSVDYPLTACGLAGKSLNDAFVTVMTPSLTGLLYSTLIAGNGYDNAAGVAVGAGGAIYVAGATDSQNFPTTANAFDPTHQSQCNGCGSRDAFLSRITDPIAVCSAPPAAASVSTVVSEDTPKILTLTVTDTGGNTDPPEVLTWQMTQQPLHGTVDVTSGTMIHGFGGAYTVDVLYSPASNYFGADSIKFVANDGTANSVVATISINVQSVGDAPTVNDQSVSTPQGAPVTITLTGSDVENNIAAWEIVTGPVNGTLTGTGAVRQYTPAAGFSGADAFTFRAKDGTNLFSAPGTVSITVVPDNVAPNAIADAATIAEDQPADIAVLGNDTDADGDTLTVQSITQGAHGTVTINANGTVKYSPAPDYNGPDSFTYVAADPEGATATATVGITVTAVNDVPSIVSPGNQASQKGQAVSLQLAGGDVDLDALVFSAIGLPTGLSIGAGGLISGTTTAAGVFGVTLTVDDGHGGTASVAIVWTVVNPVNQAPVCAAAQPSIALLTTPNHAMVPIQIAGVTDPDGDAVTTQIVSIFQDEVTYGGDASTSIDGQIAGGTAFVRAERGGQLSGRVYHVSFTATDAAGASCGGKVLVGVPNKGTLGDSGPLYDSTKAGAPYDNDEHHGCGDAFDKDAPQIGAVTGVVVPGLTPAFDPAVFQYTMPKALVTNCFVPVTVTLANPAQHTLFIQSVQTASGATRNAWVCDGKTKIDIVVYKNWKEVVRYTVTPQ